MKRGLLAITMLGLALLWGSVAAAQDGTYRINPGDTLRVEVLEDPDLNRSVLVTPDGRVSFPLAGTVRAGGRSVGQVERALSSALADDFASTPTVFVSVTGVAAPQRGAVAADAGDAVMVYLVGEVNSPGPKSVEAGSSVLQLLAQSGGFTPFAATKRLQLRRQDPHTGRERLFKINYRAISQGARIVNQPTLREGDVVLVPERRLFE